MRLLQAIMAASASLVLVGGCMMPAYRAPAGFSGSYFRHLYSPDPRAGAKLHPHSADAPAVEILPPEGP